MKLVKQMRLNECSETRKILVISVLIPVGPIPGMMLTTPSGKPASLVKAATCKPVRGVCSETFMTIVFPGGDRSGH